LLKPFGNVGGGRVGKVPFGNGGSVGIGGTSMPHEVRSYW